jgi:pimeloyl-ACP methyl ester carboxylesterase
MGLGAQLTMWPDRFCELLAQRGFHVIRYDNRDVGLSTKFDDAPVPDVLAAMSGDSSSAAYTLNDMADDAAGLLDALGVRAAHVAGASMGGMIAQEIAIRHPERVLSLCSIMSTTGDRTVGQPAPEVMSALLRPPPATREEAAERRVEGHRAWGSRGFPVDEEELRRDARAAYDRCWSPMGTARQLVAILASGDRTEALGGVRVPTLVIHGTDDRLVGPDGGEATAKAVAGADLLLVEGMGHDLPEGAWPQLVEAIAGNARAGRIP